MNGIETQLTELDAEQVASERQTTQTADQLEISGPQIRPWVRYFARTIDIAAFSFISGAVLGFVYPAALNINETLFGVIVLIAYLFVEPLLLATWGTTLGKWLLKVRLRTFSGNKLSYSDALGRTFSVLLRGMGLGLPLISLITLIVAYNRLTKEGTTSWDYDGGYVVSHQEIGPFRLVIIIIVMIAGVYAIALGTIASEFSQF